MKGFQFVIPLIIGALVLNMSVTKPGTEFSEIRNKVIGCPPTKMRIHDSLQDITINDNRQPAGEFKNGIFYINLETRTGFWYPETNDASGLRVHAFAEKGKPLQLPGPVIRVPAGTEIRATITNSIKEHPLVLYGFYSRPGNASDSIVIETGETHEIRFNAGVPGTYFYRASASDSIDNGLPWFNDSQLYGAFIVDPPNEKPDPAERIFMIGIWNDTTNGPANGGEELVLNGLSWPFTEKLNYRQGEKVHWRLINVSNQVHPMHLHGFFFAVNSKGQINKDVLYSNEFRRIAVTELMHPGETITMTWIPEREGNWLFHCHTLVHIMPGSFLRAMPEMNEHTLNNLNTHAHDGMGGLIMGIRVSPNGNTSSTIPKESIIERQLTLVIGEQANYLDTLSGKGFILLESGSLSSEKYRIPGPPIVLTKDQPVAIKIINHLKEPTSMHWHGLEIESYYDGVAGWGNKGNQLAPLILPGDSFIVRIKPPRAGTYIYHTHMHDLQLLDGMCGALIVLNPGEIFQPETDKIFLISQVDKDFERKLFLLNGTDKTDTMLLKKGEKHRLRMINITALGPDLNVSLLLKNKPVHWRLVAKDGADLPPKQCLTKKASAQAISIGETMDFEFQPKEPGNYLFEVRGENNRSFVTKVIAVL